MGLGKGILGAVIGGMLGGPLGAIIGGGIGVMMNSKPERPNHGINPGSGTGAAPLRGISLFFQALGKLAKADGHVSQDEADFVREIMNGMNFDSDVRNILKNEFNAGRDSSRSFEEIVSELARFIDSGGMPSSAKREMAQIFCALAAVDRRISPEEREILIHAGRILNAQETVRAFFARNDTERENRREYQDRSDPTLAGCFKTLGIPETASDEEVKKAWRQKAKAFHPDRIQGSGLSEEFIELAKEKLQSINLAYETIRKARGF